MADPLSRRIDRLIGELRDMQEEAEKVEVERDDLEREVARLKDELAAL